ncbi:MAG: hypothetical protein Tsb0015_02360 [Simkaniaceae bacterium]
MRKIIFWFIGILIVLFAAFFIAWNLLPTFVSSSLSDKAKVDVSIGHIGIYPSSISAENIKVGNPAGSILPQALKVDKLKADVPITHFFDRQIIIPMMTLDDIYLGLEFDKKGSKTGNWTTIMDNLNKSMDSDSKKSSQSKKDPSEKAKRSVLIKKLILTNIKIELVYRSEGKVHKLDPIPRLEFTNVSSEGGLPTAQITNLIMQHMLKEVFSIKNLQNMIEGVIKGSSDGVLDTIKGFFSQKEDITPSSARREEDLLAEAPEKD